MKQSIKSKKAIWAWCAYDWSVSSFSVVVITFVFASYFTDVVAQDKIIGTAQWANAMALAGILVAILSPVLGSIADDSGRRKYWLGGFTYLIVISSGLLWFAYPNVSHVNFFLACVVLGTIGLSVANVFYNAMLPDVAHSDAIGRVSGWGWGMGYFGGLATLLIAYYGFVQTHPSWLNAASYAQVRICGPLVALWIMLFSLPIFLWVSEKNPAKKQISLRRSMSHFLETLRLLRQEKNILTFLIAQMIYLDGLNTIFAFGGIYAAGTFQMTISEVLLLGIVLNTFAGLGSAILAWVNDWIGSKKTILLSLIGLFVFGVGIVIAENKSQFWVLASLLSLFVGAVQSSSRSLMAQIVPKDKITSMFGFYVLSGKISTFVGPWLLGYVTLQLHNQRAGLAVILSFFVVGAFILRGVKER